MYLGLSVRLDNLIGAWAERSLDRAMEHKRPRHRTPEKPRYHALLQSVRDGTTAELDSNELAEASRTRLVERHGDKMQLTALGEYVLGAPPVAQPMASGAPLVAQSIASQGANVLLAMGIALFLIGCGILATSAAGHVITAVPFVALGFVTVVIAASLRSLMTVTFKVAFQPPANDDTPESDDSAKTEKQPSV